MRENGAETYIQKQMYICRKVPETVKVVFKSVQ